MNIVRLFQRLMRRRSIEAPQHYYLASIHEGVPLKELFLALAAGGLTCSSVAGRGLVIHMQDHDPARPAL